MKPVVHFRPPLAMDRYICGRWPSDAEDFGKRETEHLDKVTCRKCKSQIYRWSDKLYFSQGRETPDYKKRRKKRCTCDWGCGACC